MKLVGIITQKIINQYLLRYFFLLLLMVTFSCYSQDKPIEILLKTDSIITTDWIELHDFPLFQSPYIRIHNLNGPKIKIRSIKNYNGYDQYGNYRQLDVIDFNVKRKYYFTERNIQLDSAERVKIYFDQLIFGLEDNSWKIKTINYSLNNKEIRKLNYRNVKNDLININISNNNLKKANQIIVIQFISIGLGAALLPDVLIENWNPTDAEFMNKESSFKLFASGLFLTLPFTLEKPKQKRLLKYYEIKNNVC